MICIHLTASRVKIPGKWHGKVGMSVQIDLKGSRRAV